MSVVPGYDIYLQNDAINGGTSLGFRLAYTGLQWGGRVAGLQERPFEAWREWVPADAYPHDPSKGAWAPPYRWTIWLALLPHMTLKTGKLPADYATRDPGQMREEIAEFRARGAGKLTEPDGTVRAPVVITAWQEWCVEIPDTAHPEGGWIVRIELADVTGPIGGGGA